MKRLTIPFLFLLYFFTLYNAEQNLEPIICIDPGHGGMDSGTSVDGLKESDIVLKISFVIKEVLDDLGYITVLTRESKDSLCEGKFIKKEDMDKRIKIVDDSNASILISIHLNYFADEIYSGAQLFYSDKNHQSKKLAQYIQDSIKDNLNNTNRTVVYRDNIYLLNKVKIPSCIIECGFMSNKEELKNLIDYNYQKNLAYAIALGIGQFI